LFKTLYLIEIDNFPVF